MPEFENREMIKSASQNAKALKHIFKWKKGVAYLWVFMVLVAAQEQAINTRNYQEVICGQQVESIFIQNVFAI